MVVFNHADDGLRNVRVQTGNLARNLLLKLLRCLAGSLNLTYDVQRDFSILTHPDLSIQVGVLPEAYLKDVLRSNDVLVGSISAEGTSDDKHEDANGPFPETMRNDHQEPYP